MEMLMEKEDFTYKHKVLITIAISFILSGTLFSQIRVRGKTDSIIAKIDFQRGFKNDSIDLKLNNTNILKNVILTSHSLSDFTGLVLEIIYSKDKEARIRYRKKNKIIPLSSNDLLIEMNLNGVYYKFYADLSKGIYLGIYKSKKNKLEFVQSERKFSYD
jgi:hypothetical protein